MRGSFGEEPKKEEWKEIKMGDLEDPKWRLDRARVRRNRTRMDKREETGERINMNEKR